MKHLPSQRKVLVYVIEAISGVCKIGCSYNPVSRAKMVHMHSPVATRLIAKWPGIQHDEVELHQRFSLFREHSEWFRIEGDLAAFIEDVRGRNVEVPDWHEITWKSKQERMAVPIEARMRQSQIMKEHWASLTAERRARWIASMRGGRRPEAA